MLKVVLEGYSKQGVEKFILELLNAVLHRFPEVIEGWVKANSVVITRFLGAAGKVV